AHRLQSPLPGDGGLPDHARGQRPNCRTESGVHRRRQQRGALAAICGQQLGADVWVATPPGYEPDSHAVAWAAVRSAATDASCTITNDPNLAASGADVVYTDVWASMGQEAEAAARRKTFQPYPVNATLFATAKPDAIFMHCLPAHRGDE